MNGVLQPDPKRRCGRCKRSHTALSASWNPHGTSGEPAFVVINYPDCQVFVEPVG